MASSHSVLPFPDPFNGRGLGRNGEHLLRQLCDLLCWQIVHVLSFHSRGVRCSRGGRSGGRGQKLGAPACPRKNGPGATGPQQETGREGGLIPFFRAFQLVFDSFGCLHNFRRGRTACWFARKEKDHGAAGPQQEVEEKEVCRSGFQNPPGIFMMLLLESPDPSVCCFGRKQTGNEHGVRRSEPSNVRRDPFLLRGGCEIFHNVRICPLGKESKNEPRATI